MQNSTVYKLYSFCVLLALSAMLAVTASAETFHLSDGQTITGEFVSLNESGVILRQADGSYTDRIPYGKMSQADLKELQANPKAAAFVEPFIELTAEDKAKRTEVEIRPVPRIERPTGHSFFGALTTSGIGIFLLILVYAANIYAAYEVSVFRAQSPGLVCGVSAALPIIGPIIFLSMPTKVKQKEAEWQPPVEEYAEEGVAAAVNAEEVAHAEAAAVQAAAVPAAPSYPPTKTFARGQFTFNRRFFETQMPGFFPVVRPEADKDMTLLIRSSRGSYVGQRICRISATDLNVQVEKEGASHEVTIPFIEIQEVQIKHKDAP